MPKLVKLYVTSVAIGFALGAVFVAMLLWFDVAGLGRLVLASPSGWIAGLMLWAFNGIVFGGVQFGIAVMRLGQDDDHTPRGGRLIPIRVPVVARSKPGAPRRR
ncbi:MAG: hypothetical protein CFE34_16305 [Rhodobacteraceae bacterium PARR1]|nr:MAG: hypothetical protein CFE34_16305 [Rhodobacteraceae bacterium PARR1]